MIFQPLYGHTDGINCLAHWNSIAASGSDDGTVKLWDLSEYQCVSTIEGFFDKRIVSVCHNPRLINQLFVACGNRVMEFDLRNQSTVVSLYEPV